MFLLTSRRTLCYNPASLPFSVKVELYHKSASKSILDINFYSWYTIASYPHIHISTIDAAVDNLTSVDNYAIIEKNRASGINSAARRQSHIIPIILLGIENPTIPIGILVERYFRQVLIPY